MSRFFACLSIAIPLLLCNPLRAQEEDSFNREPISYSTAQPHDPIQRLQKRIAAGQLKLGYSDAHGYLESVLSELHIPIASQTLVFSKTSFQRDRISAANPRALYFDDETYVGYVPGGTDIEIATTDPAIGTVFYTVDQHPAPAAAGAPGRGELVRETDNCLACHAGSMTRDIPGLLMRSIFPDSDSNPILPAGTFITTQESPLAERWGGWFATGIEPAQLGMANAQFHEQPGSGEQPGQTLPRAQAVQLHNAADYLTPGSDAVALLVLAHQIEAHNRFTRAVYSTRLALRDEKVLADALGEKPKPGEHSDSTMSRVKSACDPLVRYLLFSNEAAIPPGVKVQADSAFAREFSARGPRDPHGRSLRDLDLKTRLFRYPCSYLIYSASFDQLPDVARDYVYRQLWNVLWGKDTSKDFAHLAPVDRQAIREILLATKPNLPTYWRR